MATESRTNRETIEELLRRDHYTPEELAELVGMSAHQIRHAVRAGELRGLTVDHHVLAIRREDVVSWLLSGLTKVLDRVEDRDLLERP
jgi:DNA-binding CsgD family transcriptional regulator